MVNEETKKERIKPRINMVDLIQSLVFVYITCVCVCPIKRCALILTGKEEEEKKIQKSLYTKEKKVIVSLQSVDFIC